MNKNIFVSIASYCDPMLDYTINCLFENAENPNNVFVGLVDQSFETLFRFNDFKFKNNIRKVLINPIETRGASWARFIAMSLHHDEQYFLQIDSHTKFEEKWDKKLIELYEEAKDFNKNEDFVITTYPPGFTLEQVDQKNDSFYVIKPCENQTFPKEHYVLEFQAYEHLNIDNEKFRFGMHVAAGFIFTNSRFLNQFFYDPKLYFIGEEQLMALRLFTKGWNIICPNTMDIPLYHMYKVPNVVYESVHWNDKHDKQRNTNWWILDNMSKNRFKSFIENVDENMFGLGNKRSLNDFKEFTGIDYKNKLIDYEKINKF